jgi:CBS domain-containing protein
MTDPDPAPEAAPSSETSHHKNRGVLSLFDRFRSRPSPADDAPPEPPTAATGELVSQARAFQDLRVDDVMKPRADIVAIDRSCSFAELTARFVEAEHSRMPVYRDTLDDPVGVVHVKDVFKLLARKTRKPRSTDHVLSGRHNLVRQVLYVPASMRASELLGQMRAEQTHMALVIDEFGGTDGLVTLEDLLETLVGEISERCSRTWRRRSARASTSPRPTSTRRSTRWRAWSMRWPAGCRSGARWSTTPAASPSRCSPPIPGA